MEFLLLEITLTKPLEPRDIKALLEACEKVLPAAGREGVIVSGRMPVWAFAAIVHYYHPRPVVGTYYPPKEGGIIVQSHVAEFNVGDVIRDIAKTVELEL